MGLWGISRQILGGAALVGGTAAAAWGARAGLAHRGEYAGPLAGPASGVAAATNSAANGATSTGDASRVSPLAYAGYDRHGIPRYTRRTFNAEERRLLRDYFGVSEPARLYLTDSSAAARLEYDTRPKLCRACLVNSYIVGAPSLRRPGETWEELEHRVVRMRRHEFPEWTTEPSTGLSVLDPEVRTAFARMLADARRAGFPVQVVETFRSPLRSAFVYWIGRGRTRTITSVHSLGRAVDVVVWRGDPKRARVTPEWIRFRRWVTRYDGGRFKLIGTPANTWDWPHVEYRGEDLGFHSIEEALAAARGCEARTREQRASRADAPPVDCAFGSRGGGSQFVAGVPRAALHPAVSGQTEQTVAPVRRPAAHVAAAPHGASRARDHRAIAARLLSQRARRARRAR